MGSTISADLKFKIDFTEKIKIAQMKNVWILLFLSIVFHRMNAMDDDNLFTENNTPDFDDKTDENEESKIDLVNNDKIEDDFFIMFSNEPKEKIQHKNDDEMMIAEQSQIIEPKHDEASDMLDLANKTDESENSKIELLEKEIDEDDDPFHENIFIHEPKEKIQYKFDDTLKLEKRQIIELEHDEASEAREQFHKIIQAQNDCFKYEYKHEKFNFQFHNYFRKVMKRLKRSEINALQPQHLYGIWEERFTSERERVLKKFMKSFEFGGIFCVEHMGWACNSFITFPDGKSIKFYKESFSNGNFHRKIVDFQLHWDLASFPLLIQFKQKQFLFRYIHRAIPVLGSDIKSVRFFYYGLENTEEYITILVKGFEFDTAGKYPLKVTKAKYNSGKKLSDVIDAEMKYQPPQKIDALTVEKMVRYGVWFDVEEIKAAFEQFQNEMKIKIIN